MNGSNSVILMISDGLGFEGWRIADIHERGAPRRQAYQRLRSDGGKPVVLGKSQTALLGSGERRPDRPENRHPFADACEGAIDSAAAATALLSGRWVPNGHINVTADGEHLVTLAEEALARGLGAGVVTSVQAAHATPAAAAAHVDDRGLHEEIFRQLLASGLHVIMGCGHPFHDEGGLPRAEPDHGWVGGEHAWRRLASGGAGAALLQDRDDFIGGTSASRAAERIVGIPRNGATLQQRRPDLPPDPKRPSGVAFDPTVPTLAEMTLAALRVLGRHDGFFLLVEGGAVDWSNHANDLPRMLEEQMEFNRAVEAVAAWVERHRSWDDTLLVVTADHETGGIRSAADPASEAGRPSGLAHYTTMGHTTELVPLWALGAGSERLAIGTRVDPYAALRWGEAYGWDGRYVDATQVHAAMRSVFLQGVGPLATAPGS